MIHYPRIYPYRSGLLHDYNNIKYDTSRLHISWDVLCSVWKKSCLGIAFNVQTYHISFAFVLIYTMLLCITEVVGGIYSAEWKTIYIYKFFFGYITSWWIKYISYFLLFVQIYAATNKVIKFPWLSTVGLRIGQFDCYDMDILTFWSIPDISYDIYMWLCY